MDIYLGENKENLEKGAAHLTQTSLPVGVVNANFVIAIHRGMSTAAIFRDIEKLEIGDEAYIMNFREMLKYRVKVRLVLSIRHSNILLLEGVV